MATPVNRAHRCTRWYLGNHVSPTASLVGHPSYRGKYACHQPISACTGENEMKWTIRNMEPEAIVMIAVIAERSGWTYGALVSEAIAVWYESLPYEDDDDHESLQAA